MELFSQKLRARLLAHIQQGTTLREIARQADIDVAQLHRFAGDTGKLGQDAIDRLHHYLPKRVQ